MMPPHMSLTRDQLFPDDDFKFHLRFGRGAPAEFFAPTETNAELIAERRRWLRSEVESCAAVLPSGVALIEETAQLAHNWNGFVPPAIGAPVSDPARSEAARERAGSETGAPAAWAKLLALGEFWEPDFLLLKADADGEIRLHGGCVCFPSSWRLSEKLGRPIEFIHDVVPGLNATLGPAIHKFLAGLKPGLAWLRSNWGLSRSSELNQHPDRALPRLDAGVHAGEVWLRVEHQALVALPESGGILFGIRIETQSLVEVKGETVLARRLSRALRTLPEPMAVYKGIAPARGRLLELLGN